VWNRSVAEKGFCLINESTSEFQSVGEEKLTCRWVHFLKVEAFWAFEQVL